MIVLALNMPLVRRLVPVVFALIVFGAVIEMIRRRRLREEYALLWLLGCVPMGIFAIWPEVIIYLQGVLQTNYLTIVMLSGFGFLALIILHLSAVLTRRSEEVRSLAQSVALLRKQVQSLQEGADPPEETSADTHQA